MGKLISKSDQRIWHRRVLWLITTLAVSATLYTIVTDGLLHWDNGNGMCGLSSPAWVELPSGERVYAQEVVFMLEVFGLPHPIHGKTFGTLEFMDTAEYPGIWDIERELSPGVFSIRSQESGRQMNVTILASSSELGVDRPFDYSTFYRYWPNRVRKLDEICWSSKENGYFAGEQWRPLAVVPFLLESIQFMKLLKLGLVTVIAFALWLWWKKHLAFPVGCCQECGYDLQGHQGNEKCPECGWNRPEDEGEVERCP